MPKRGHFSPIIEAGERPSLGGLRPNRDIFKDKRYLPIGLVEAGRGCHFRCDFCAVQTVFNQSQTRRPADDILEEIEPLARQAAFLFCGRQYHLEHG